jgi:phytoene synthase
VSEGLHGAARALAGEGLAVPPLEGKLLRPLVAYALVPPALRPRLDRRFWMGALAVQMIHEASLVHDDILDGASERRGSRTLVAARGLGPALVLGDHYLTGAYRAAAGTASADFLDIFIRAVERTVAGEVAQGRSAGRRLEPSTYLDIVTGKSGELFGAATALGGALLGIGGLPERVALGRELGALYQRVDDLLDYCAAAATGKPPLQDFRQAKWTWVLDLARVASFEDLDEVAVLDRIFLPRDGGPSPARRALNTLQSTRDDLVMRAAELAPGDGLTAGVLDGWLAAAREGVRDQERALAARAVAGADPPPSHGAAGASARADVISLASRVGAPAEWSDYFRGHARTFHFASRLFPADASRSIEGVYAFCRFTDDLVDAPHDGADRSVLLERLGAWEQLVRIGLGGRRTGVPLVDEVIGRSLRHGVDPAYPLALVRGVRTDLVVDAYRDLAELEGYTFGVAASVGGWITQLFGIREPELLERAHALGHAMQLTNILRDVGEDLARGRLYVPETLLQAHGITRERLTELQASDEPVPDDVAALMEELMALADARYEAAWPGIRALPAWFRRPVAVAAEGYRAIHDAVRRNGYDTLRKRASTGFSTKLARASRGLMKAAGGRA